MTAQADNTAKSLPIRLRAAFAAWVLKSLGDEAADEIERLKALLNNAYNPILSSMATAVCAGCGHGIGPFPVGRGGMSHTVKVIGGKTYHIGCG